MLLTPSTFDVGVPDQVLGWFLSGFVKDKLLNFHVGMQPLYPY